MQASDRRTNESEGERWRATGSDRTQGTARDSERQQETAKDNERRPRPASPCSRRGDRKKAIEIGVHLETIFQVCKKAIKIWVIWGPLRVVSKSLWVVSKIALSCVFGWQATDGATDREIDFDLQKKQANNQATDGATLFEWLQNRSVACFWVASKSLGSMVSQSLGRMPLWGSIWCTFWAPDSAFYARQSSKMGVTQKSAVL